MLVHQYPVQYNGGSFCITLLGEARNVNQAKEYIISQQLNSRHFPFSTWQWVFISPQYRYWKQVILLKHSHQCAMLYISQRLDFQNPCYTFTVFLTDIWLIGHEVWCIIFSFRFPDVAVRNLETSEEVGQCTSRFNRVQTDRNKMY